jgi:hypothetical protein
MATQMADMADSQAPERPRPAQRGLLVVEARAAQRLIEGVVERSSPNVSDPHVDIRSLSDDGIEIDMSISLEYPSDPLSSVLADLRRRVAAEAGRQLGRPVRRVI